MKYLDNLHTARLFTRPLVYEDNVAWADFFANKEASKYLTTLGEDDHKRRSIAWINRQLNRYQDDQYGLQALVNKQTGEFIGQCGLLLQQLDGVTELEIGYHIFPKFWGLGFATEAAQAFKLYALQNRLGPSVISIIHQGNTTSKRVAEKNGMHREKATQFFGLDVFVYRLVF